MLHPILCFYKQKITLIYLPYLNKITENKLSTVLVGAPAQRIFMRCLQNVFLKKQVLILNNHFAGSAIKIYG